MELSDIKKLCMVSLGVSMLFFILYLLCILPSLTYYIAVLSLIISVGSFCFIKFKYPNVTVSDIVYCCPELTSFLYNPKNTSSKASFGCGNPITNDKCPSKMKLFEKLNESSFGCGCGI